MPGFGGSLSIGAGATADLLNTTSGILRPWKYNRAPYNGMCELMLRTTAVGVNYQVTSGSDEIVQQSPVQSGGTAGVTPSRLNTEPVTFLANQGDVISIPVTNTTAGALTVDFWIEITRAK